MAVWKFVDIVNEPTRLHWLGESLGYLQNARGQADQRWYTIWAAAR